MSVAATVGIALPGWPLRRARRPGLWWYRTEEEARISLVPDLHQVFVAADPGLLAFAHACGAVCIWALDALPSGPVELESLISRVSAIVTPWPSVADQVLRRWPVYDGRIHILSLRRSRPGAGVVVGERAWPQVPGFSLWSGRGFPTARECWELWSPGRPVLGPARGGVVDLVRALGGATVEDRLGSDSERELVLAAAERGRPVRGFGGIEIADVALRVLSRVSDAVPCTWTPEPDGHGIVVRPPDVPRSQAALLLESRCLVTGFTTSDGVDQFEVSPKRRTTSIPAAWRPRTVQVSACMVIGAPRDTLPAALASLRGAVDELCVVYTEAPDPRVSAAASELGVPVRERVLADWGFDFARARNASLDLGTGDYALVIDDDEQLIGGGALRGLLAPRVVDGLLLGIVNLEPRSGVLTQTLQRVVRLGIGRRFVCPLHETVDGSPERVCGVGRPYILHHGYSDPATVREKQRKRNPEILRSHMAVAYPHPRLSALRLRDTWAALTYGVGSVGDLADAVITVQRAIIAAGEWEEYLGTAEVFADALTSLGRGLTWDFDLAPPGAEERRRVRLGFLEPGDLRRFLTWWGENATGPQITRPRPSGFPRGCR